MLERLEAWLSFIYWYASVEAEPYLSVLRHRVSLLYSNAKLRLLKLLKGSDYPFKLLRPEVVEAFKRIKRLERVSPTPVQVLAIPRILRGRNVLITAPTGSGKTEAAFLPILSRLLEEKRAAEREGRVWPRGTHVVYITPMRALCSDIAARLNQYVTATLGLRFSAGAWHSDVEELEKRVMEDAPPTILVTTPESLEAILDTGKRICRSLKNLKYVIIDEVHELSESKRGHQLLIVLERLKHSLGLRRLQRVLISATVADPSRIAEMFGGSDGPIEIVRYPSTRRMRVHVLFHPAIDEEEAAKVISGLTRAKRCLVFVNTRAEAELIHAGLESLELTRSYSVHHSSLSSKVRRSVEETFRRGSFKAIICTRTLELGIDIGDVQKVIQVGSPSLPEALVQRLGRSAHRPGEEAQGTVLCLETADILEVLALANLLGRGRLIAETRLPACLDVTARALTAVALQRENFTAPGGRKVDLAIPSTWEEVLSVLRKARPYRSLGEEILREVLGVLEVKKVVRTDSGSRSPLLGESFRKVWGGKSYARFFSMIPEKESLAVKFRKGTIGEIDPVNLRYIRKGAVIRLAGSNWVVKDIKGRDVIVEVAETESYTVPVWKGGYYMTPRALGIETYRLLSRLSRKQRKWEAQGSGCSLVFGGYISLHLEGEACSIVRALADELQRGKFSIPGPRLMVVERINLGEEFLDRRSPESCTTSGKGRRDSVTVMLYPFGERLANTLASPLWRIGDVRFVVPKTYGILVRHDEGFDPLKYFLRLSEEELRESVGNAENPYVVSVAYEIKRSFGFTKLKDALANDLVFAESVKQGSARFYDVEGALKLLKWIKYGCVRVDYREVRSAEQLHPLSIHLFKANAFLQRKRAD